MLRTITHQAPKERSSVTSHWVSIDGLRLHALRHEDPGHGAPPVVLIHGHSLSSQYLRPCLRLLGAMHPVLAPDLPGYGHSWPSLSPLGIDGHADVLARWARRLHLEGAVFVGNSMGCQVITSLASRHPGVAGAVVLASPPLEPSRRNRAEAVARFLVNLVQERKPMRTLNALGIARGDKTTLLANLHDTVHYRIEQDLPRVQVPALVVHGSRDPIVSRRWARRVAQLLPAAQFVEVPGGTHLLPHHDATVFARLVRDFSVLD